MNCLFEVGYMLCRNCNRRDLLYRNSYSQSFLPKMLPLGPHILHMQLGQPVN